MDKVYYAGIGSRETPVEILEVFRDIAELMDTKYDFVLRSGHADGADIAFEQGCDRVYGGKEIYLPWSGFNGSDSKLVVKDIRAFELAQKFHPYWFNLKDGARKLQARNSHQVLGVDLDTPSSFVVCWTKKGKGSGGTGQAIRMAKAYNIPVFDAGGYDNISDFYDSVMTFADSIKLL